MTPPRIPHDFNNLLEAEDDSMAVAPLLDPVNQDFAALGIEIKLGMKVILYEAMEIDSEGNTDYCEVEAIITSRDDGNLWGRFYCAEFVVDDRVIVTRPERDEI